MRDKKQQIKRVMEYYPLLFDINPLKTIFPIKEKYIQGEYSEGNHVLFCNFTNRDMDFISLQSLDNGDRERFELYVGDDPEKICGIIRDDFHYTNEFYVQLYKYNIIVDSDHSSTDLTKIHRTYIINEIIGNE